MRLICPNCGAQYEVPESVIPESGRDVQCSSCGNTWFQHHPLYAPAAQEEDEPVAADTGAAAWDDADDPDDDPDSFEDRAEDKPHASAQPEPAPQQVTVQDATDDGKIDDDQEIDTDDDDQDDDEWQGFPTDPGLTAEQQPGDRLVPDPEDPVSRIPDVDEDDYEEDPARDLPAPRRSLDTSVADMLREEAEREARARAAERGTGLESQPDLGLDSGPATPQPDPAQQDGDALRRSEEAKQRMARLRGDDQVNAQSAASTDLPQRMMQPPQPTQPVRGPVTEDDQIAAAAAAAVADSRRGLLPDIEEINSTLRSTSDRRPARADDHDTPGRSADAAPAQVAPARGFSRGFSITILIAALLLALYVFAPALVEALPAAEPVMDSYVAMVDDLRIVLDAQVQKLSRWLAEVAGSTG